MTSNSAKTLQDLIGAAPGDHTAIVLPEEHRRVTYDNLHQQVQEAAAALASLGIGRGDRVAMALPNGLPTIVGFLAASIAGTAAPLNPAYREEEFRFYLKDTGARVILLPREGADAARRAAGETVRVVSIDMDGGAVRIDPRPGAGAAARLSPEDVALVLHTSGSTGRPKRVPLTHANLCASARHISATYGLGPSDVTMCVMPLFHVHGLVASTLSTLATGGTVVVPSRFNPLSFWRVARDAGATWYSAVPTLHQLLLARAGHASGRPHGTERLRFIRSCSAALAPQMMHELETAFGAPVLEAYGMTEAAHQMASNPLPPGPRKAGSVGAGTGVRIGIMDRVGRLLTPGERGEVVVGGPNVIAGYENDPAANAMSFTDGWFRTGDQGYLDDDGYLHLVGRIKELINRGGEKVSPREIDDVLLAHPAVAEAVSFGVPHRAWGEEVAAVVVLTGEVTESKLLAYCRERLAEFKCPKQIHITEAIPRTATGKIQRRVVAEAYSRSSS
jgi:acyl-CoA synthetase (AMP-forming)/AMP-acid ligase II